MRPQHPHDGLAIGKMAVASRACAHGFAGAHMFISTLLIDDPNAADAASLPTVNCLPQPTDRGPAPQPQLLDRRCVASVQHPLPVVAGEGLWAARLHQRADAGGRKHLDVDRAAAGPGPNRISAGAIGLDFTATCAAGLEMLVPGNGDTGSHLGVTAQFHLYFDDLFPHSPGAPIVDWFKT